MGKPLIDLTGRRFEKLTVLERAGFVGGKTVWRCSCDCGAIVEVRGAHLRSGRQKSCGCLRAQKAAELNVTHGHARGSETRTYKCWKNMMQRCHNSKNTSFCDYGARGISVCDRWHDFGSFLADMGAAPDGLTIDRIDNSGNYEPSNCRWATYQEQALNTRRNVWLLVNGEKMCRMDFQKQYRVGHRRFDEIMLALDAGEEYRLPNATLQAMTTE